MRSRGVAVERAVSKDGHVGAHGPEPTFEAAPRCPAAFTRPDIRCPAQNFTRRLAALRDSSAGRPSAANLRNLRISAIDPNGSPRTCKNLRKWRPGLDRSVAKMTELSKKWVRLGLVWTFHGECSNCSPTLPTSPNFCHTFGQVALHGWNEQYKIGDEGGCAG